MNHRARGFTLLELMLAMALGAVVLTGALQLALAVNRALAVQQGIGELQSQARYAEALISGSAAGAGYAPRPWADPQPAPTAGSRNGLQHDVLVLRQWSQTNCLANPNPVLDASGAPEFYLRVSEWRLGNDQRLLETCHYGPGGTPGTRQLNASTRVEGVEAFQALFAEDLDGDGRTDRWVRAEEWADPNRVLGLRFALLMVSSTSLGADRVPAVDVLDQRVTPPDDGRARLLIERTVAFTGQRS
jgi:prepilin-type N-terminal cleavage/methylation domain-containing protein